MPWCRRNRVRLSNDVQAHKGQEVLVQVGTSVSLLLDLSYNIVLLE